MLKYLQYNAGFLIYIYEVMGGYLSLKNFLRLHFVLNMTVPCVDVLKLCSVAPPVKSL